MKHILLLFTDEQRYDTLGANRAPGVQTPHLDALAAQSTVFDRCYTPSPVCVPARLSLLSGQYPARTGNNNNNTQKVYDGQGLYARLTQAGYESCCVGKVHYAWDLYAPLGFSRRITQEEKSHPLDDYTAFIQRNYPHVFDYHGMRSEMYYVPQISPLPPAAHPTQWVGDRSVEYIRSYDSEKPMFLMASFVHPHPPFSPPAPWQKLFRDDPPEPFIPPEQDLDEYADALLNPAGSCRRLMMSRQDVLRAKNFYYACISFVDYQVGRILQALRDRGMYDDTLILFSSDHGDMMGDYGAMGKRTMFDAATRVPLLIRRPGSAPGRRGDPCSLVDVAPTLLSWAGADVPQGEFDGVDLFGGQRHRAVYSQYGCAGEGTYAVTDGARKLIYSGKARRYFYFDALPEEKDCYDPRHPQVLRLQPLLERYRDSDVSKVPGPSSGMPNAKKHPHYVARVDHVMRHDEELAAIPKEYHIDLDP